MAFGPFFKNAIILFVVPPKFCISIVFNFSWGEERCVTILKTAARETSFVIELSSFNQVGIFFSECF